MFAFSKASRMFPCIISSEIEAVDSLLLLLLLTASFDQGVGNPVLIIVQIPFFLQAWQFVLQKFPLYSHSYLHLGHVKCI